jgi:UDP-N-acetylglucosamine pyrophosphorylase
MVENGYLAGAKYINKASWDEKVGVHCIRNGRVEVVEYSELSADYA